MIEYVFTALGRTRWHIESPFQPAPFAYSFITLFLYHWMLTLCLHFLNEIDDNLPPEKRNEWESVWMVSDRRTGPIHPLIYPHLIAQKKVNFKTWYFVLFLCSQFLNHCNKMFLTLTRSVQSLRLYQSREPMRSFQTLQSTLLIPPKYPYFLSYSPSMLMDSPHFFTSFKILSRWKYVVDRWWGMYIISLLKQRNF